jgi:hypothetical protein
MRAPSEPNIPAAEPREFGHPQAGLDSDNKQGRVPAADPVGTVGRRHQGVDLVSGEEGHARPSEPFGRNGQHPFDSRGVLRVLKGSEAEE